MCSFNRRSFLFLLFLVFFSISRFVSAQTLWSTPDNVQDIISIEQPISTARNGVQGGNGVGQSFIPVDDHIYRLSFFASNRSDERSFSVKLWKWDDANGNDVAENSEYAVSTTQVPVWEGRVAVTGPDVIQEINVYPNIGVVPGDVYYLEFFDEDLTSEVAIYSAWSLSSEDNYLGGDLRVNGFFRRGNNADLQFTLYSEKGTEQTTLTCIDSHISPPCLSSANPQWEAPLAAGSPITRHFFRDIIENKMNVERTAIVNGNGGNASRYTAYEAFLYQAYNDDQYAENALLLFEKIKDYRLPNANSPAAYPNRHVGFEWLEWPAWAYYWIKDYSGLSDDNHRMIKSLLLDDAARFYENNREYGPHNRSLGGALSLKLVTDLIQPEEFSQLTSCSTNPEYCDLFHWLVGENCSQSENACEVLPQLFNEQDHINWQSYADGQWAEFKAQWDFIDESTHYHSLSWRYVLELIKLYGESSSIWQNSDFLALVERFSNYVLPTGDFPVYGDTHGVGMDWAAYAWLFEEAATQLQDPHYKWLAYKITDYRRRYYKSSPEHFWRGVHNEWIALAHGYFSINESLTGIAPLGQQETVQVSQYQYDEYDSIDGQYSPNVGQIFTPSHEVLSKVTLKLRSALDTANVELLLWPWLGSHSDTTSQASLFHQQVSVDFTDAYSEVLPSGQTVYLKDVSITPLLMLNPNQPYYIEIRFDDSETEGVHAYSRADNVYPGGHLLKNGVEVPNQDLYFVVDTLVNRDVLVTTREQASRRRVSERSDGRVHDFVGNEVNDKLILRSGATEEDMHMVVNLLGGGHSHEHQEVGSILSLVKDGAILLTGSSINDRLAQDQNTLLTRHHYSDTGIVPALPPVEADVAHLYDYRKTGVAWINWSNLNGWPLNQGRHLYFVKNRFVWVRDYVSATQTRTTMTAGSIWHSEDLFQSDPGANWLTLFNREPKGLNGWRFRNPEQYVLLNTIPKHNVSGPDLDYRFENGEFDYQGNPSSPEKVVTQSYHGELQVGETRWLDSVLIPYGSEYAENASDLASNITVLADSGQYVVLQISIGYETWILIDNPQKEVISINVGSTGTIDTDGRYAVFAYNNLYYEPNESYFLIHDGSYFNVSEYNGIDASYHWPQAVTAEIGADRFGQ